MRKCIHLVSSAGLKLMTRAFSHIHKIRAFLKKQIKLKHKLCMWKNAISFKVDTLSI